MFDVRMSDCAGDVWSRGVGLKMSNIGRRIRKNHADDDDDDDDDDYLQESDVGRDVGDASADDDCGLAKKAHLGPLRTAYAVRWLLVRDT